MLHRQKEKGGDQETKVGSIRRKRYFLSTTGAFVQSGITSLEKGWPGALNTHFNLPLLPPLTQWVKLTTSKAKGAGTGRCFFLKKRAVAKRSDSLPSTSIKRHPKEEFLHT
jgi:hypothetical protein